MLGTGRGEEARRVIAELNNVPEDDALVIEIVEELDFAIKAENEDGKAGSDVFLGETPYAAVQSME